MINHEMLPAGAGPCAKVVVTATLVTVNGNQYIGSNHCLTPQKVCPRDTQGYPSGQGYHLCKEICNQPAHGEVNAINFANSIEENASKGAVIHVDYSWICGACSKTAEEFGATVTTDPVPLIEGTAPCDYCYQPVWKCGCDCLGSVNVIKHK